MGVDIKSSVVSKGQCVSVWVMLRMRKIKQIEREKI